MNFQYPNGDPFGVEVLKEIEDKKKASDRQVGGLHYKDMPIQPTYFTWKNKLDGNQHSVIKYICRFRTKGGLEDLLKARHYIDLLIEYEYPDYKDEDKTYDKV